MSEITPEKLLDAIGTALVMIRPDERVGHMNPEAEALLGSGLTGRHYVTALRQPSVLDCVERVLRTGAPAEAAYRPSGRERQAVFRARCKPLSMAGGQGAMLALEDVSHLEEADLIRRDFVANVSHELRTPLTGLIGFIETLRGAANDDPQARDRFLGTMQQEAGRMNRLIDDLLSLSRVEAEERVRPAGQVDLAAVLHAAAGALEPLATAAGVTLSLPSPDAGPVVRGDRDQLVQVFANLAENAIKYGAQPGEVQIGLECVENDPLLRGPAVRVTVRDQGPGIPSQHLPRLTERFYRVDGHRSRELGGTGLGLAIVKHIVNRHRGRLRIDSTEGQGSVFTVILPRD